MSGVNAMLLSDLQRFRPAQRRPVEGICSANNGIVATIRNAVRYHITYERTIVCNTTSVSVSS